MAATDRHTRLVGWAKIALPLAALALLSTLFLASRPPGIAEPPSGGGLDPEALAREPRIGAPDYAGVTPDGTAVTFTAEAARAGTLPQVTDGTPTIALAGGIAATLPRARFDLPDGQSLWLRAEAGRLDRAAGQAELAGAVQVEGSQGWSLSTGRLTADLAAGLLAAPGPVAGSAPFGTIEAGSMQLQRQAGGDHVLSFEGGVKLLYRPGSP